MPMMFSTAFAADWLSYNMSVWVKLATTRSICWINPAREFPRLWRSAVGIGIRQAGGNYRKRRHSERSSRTRGDVDLNSTSASGDSANLGSTDTGLLEGIRTRDEVAWTRFVDEYSSLIYVWCRNCDLQPVDALDVSQQVFHAVNRSIATFSRESGSGSFRGWLFVITRNLIRNYLSRTLGGPQPLGGTSIQLQLLEQPESIDEESRTGSKSSAGDSSMQAILDAVRRPVRRAHLEVFLADRDGRAIGG